MSMNFGFFMDVSILVLLAATVYLAFRLNLNLRNFKESRFEMEGLVNRLTGNIDKADRAIQGMQNAARNAGKELDEIISDAKALKDELKFMNETGNNLAGRLEKLAERNRELVDKIEQGGGLGVQASSYDEPVSKKAIARGTHDFELDEELGGFAIQDRDLGSNVFEEDDDDLIFGDETNGLQSQAERELFEALQNSKARQRRTQ